MNDKSETSKKRNKKFGWPLRIVALALVLGGGWFAYKQFFAPKATQVQYQTAPVQKGTIVSTVSASGQVSTANNTPVVTQVTGLITKVYVKNGDPVKAGQAIATVQLDQSSTQKYIQQQASYQNAQNSLRSAEINQTQMRSDKITAANNFLKQAIDKHLEEDNPTYIALKAAKSVAENKYDNQDNVINQSQTSLTSASLSLQNYSPTIVAPISGTLTGLSLQEGSVIPAQAVSSSTNTLSQNIATITTSSYAIVSINLTEIDIPSVKIGDKATVTFDAFPDKTFTGKVFNINTTGSVSSGVTTYPTTIILDTSNPQIYANMSSTANIIIDSKDDVLYVPVAAVKSLNGQSYVQVLKNGVPSNVDVTTGLSSDTDTEIVSGLNEGDEVVTSSKTTTGGTTATTGASVFGIRTGGGFGGAAARGGR